MQHAGERNIGREGHGAGHFGSPIVAPRRLADHRQFLVRRQRRRLVGGDLSLHLAETDAGDAGRKRLGAQGFLCRHGHPLHTLAAASVAVTTCG